MNSKNKQHKEFWKGNHGRFTEKTELPGAQQRGDSGAGAKVRGDGQCKERESPTSRMDSLTCEEHFHRQRVKLSMEEQACSNVEAFECQAKKIILSNQLAYSREAEHW